MLDKTASWMTVEQRSFVGISFSQDVQSLFEEYTRVSECESARSVAYY